MIRYDSTGTEIRNHMRDIVRQAQKEADAYADKLVRNAKKNISDEYRQTVTDFYEEYDPMKYWRVGNPFSKKDGLYDTADPFYHNTEHMYGGGITLKDEVEVSKGQTGDTFMSEDAFQSFLDGFHGPKQRGIWSHILPNPYEHMIKLKDMLQDECERNMQGKMEEIADKASRK